MTIKFYILIGVFSYYLVHGKTIEEKRSFFESKIRPALAENCYECHNSLNQSKGELVLDHKDGLLSGGINGPTIFPGKPDESLLIKVVSHKIHDLKMPRGGPKLTQEKIEDFKRWILDGAYDPRENPPSAKEFAEDTAWEKIREKRKSWWSFQPIRKIKPPLSNPPFLLHPVDQFIRAKLNETELEPRGDAEALTILRRLSFALTGLPPTIEEQEKFLELSVNDLSIAVEKFADELLNSPHFGERWARHWMDWVRYADSHGSEGDPKIPNAYRYRNYLIRALNKDIGFDQLVLEHLAGDLLPTPRINKQLRLNESVIGTSNLRFVLHGFAPTDALDEYVRFTDDQIDAVSKAFLGLTISCARCHHHKFDAISQDDYYALFGIFSNGRPAQLVIDEPKYLNEYEDELSALKKRIKDKLISVWQEFSVDFDSLTTTKTGEKNSDFFLPWRKLHSLENAEFSKEWNSLHSQVKESEKRLIDRKKTKYPLAWNLGDEGTYTSWRKTGTGLKSKPSKAGSFTINIMGDGIVKNVFPSGVYTNILSTKQNGTLSSNRFVFREGNLWVRVIGDKGASVRYSVWNYPRKGTIYKKLSPDPTGEKWLSFNTDYWKGETGYLEINTNRNHPVEAGDSERSWFGITEALHTNPGQAPPRDENAELLLPLFATPLKEQNKFSLKDHYSKVIKGIVEAWGSDSFTNTQARILNSLIKNNILSNSVSEIPQCSALVNKYREIELLIKSPRLAPGVLDGTPFEQSLFVRGNHKKPAHKVPRRFLEAIDETPYPKDSIGRLELAQDLLRKDNPFTSRVIVNRIWHHLFGNGLVRTPDNFGRLGELPTHPELLDYLAVKFREEGWSIKGLIKFLITSKFFRSSSKPTIEASKIDPSNLLLSHANLKRLEAESVSDSMLLISGRLKLDHVAELNSQPPNNPRRAVYREIKRNSLDPFLSVFDAPVPVSTKGRRDITNVPAQSLTLMNDPKVLRGAREFANLHQEGEIRDRVSQMFRFSLGRFPTEIELSRSLEYIDATGQESFRIERDIEEKRAILENLEEEIRKITEPIRNKILVSKRNIIPPNFKNSVIPSLHWDFSKGLIDSIEGISCSLKGGAVLKNGKLVVRKGGYAETETIPFNISEKTISVYLKLDNLKQRGGGAITLQSLNGSMFDSIVFAEKEAGIWMSGSNGFRRTQSFVNAPIEKNAVHEPVHLAISYSSDGSVKGYRNGEAYGQPYKTNTAHFRKHESVISFGLRHLPANPSRLLNGSIHEASLFDRALTNKEIKSIISPLLFVSEVEIEDNLNSALKTKLAKLDENKSALIKEIARLEEIHNSKGPKLQDLALALFNMKEFIYLK